VKEFCKSIRIWWSYNKNLFAFLGHSVDALSGISMSVIMTIAVRL